MSPDRRDTDSPEKPRKRASETCRGMLHAGVTKVRIVQRLRRLGATLDPSLCNRGCSAKAILPRHISRFGGVPTDVASAQSMLDVMCRRATWERNMSRREASMNASASYNTHTRPHAPRKRRKGSRTAVLHRSTCCATLRNVQLFLPCWTISTPSLSRCTPCSCLPHAEDL